MVCRDVSGLSQVGDSREEGPGALGTMCFLNKGSFPCCVLPLGSGYEQRQGRSSCGGGHLPGLELSGSPGFFSLGSPQYLHLAQPINTLGKGAEPAQVGQRAQQGKFSFRLVPGTTGSSLAPHMVKTSGKQRCLVPVIKSLSP